MIAVRYTLEPRDCSRGPDGLGGELDFLEQIAEFGDHRLKPLKLRLDLFDKGGLRLADQSSPAIRLDW